MTLTEALKKDPLWQETKLKTNIIKTDRILTKIEYLKVIGHQRFSNQAYKDYVEAMKKEIERNEQHLF